MNPIPFGPFEPDRSKYALKASTAIINCLPVQDGWGPMPSLVAITDALAATPKGSILVRTSTGAYAIYAGTTTTLYRMNTSSIPYTWDEIGTGYDVPVGDRWSFTLFGTNLTASNLNDGLQWIDVDTGVAFVTETAAPNAKYSWVAGEHLVLGHTENSPNEVYWCAIRDMTNWTLGSRGCSSQTFQDGNEVQGGIGSENGARIFQRDMRRRMIRNGDIASAFDIVVEDPSVGAISPLSIVNISTNNFAWLSEKGFFMGPGAEPIGFEKVDRWFLSGGELDLTYIAEVRGMLDSFAKIVWWQYQKTSGEKALLGFNYFLKRWCYSNQNIAELSAMATAAITIDGLDDLYASIDDADIAFDARLLQGGRPTLNGWNTDDELCIFAGPPLAATIETATQRLGNGFTTAHEMRVIGECPTFTVQEGTSAYHGGTETWSSAVSPSARNPGVVNFRVSALLHRYRMNIPAGTVWESMSQIEPVRVSQDGGL